MAQGPAFPPEQRLTSLPELGNVRWGEGIQCPRQRRLLGEALPPPGAGQRQIRAQACIHLHDGATASQHTDEDIQQLAGGRVIHDFQRQVQVAEHRGEKVRPGEAVPEHAQRSKGGVFWHVRQPDLWAHGTAPR